ncbi:MAG: hypothetical protein IKS34_00640 [Clostridia bacterium]|nr:hypothetical protein [Clostridia bacterium]
MNENTEAKETRTDAAGESAAEARATLGANHVFQVFRQTGKPVTTLILSVVVMLVVFFVLAGAFLGLPLLLVLIVFPFVPGIIVYREFREEVILTCRGICTETEIVSGAWKSLLYLWERYFLCLLPGIAFVVGFHVLHDFQSDWKPFRELGGSISFCLFVFLLGEFPLAIFPVARLFSRRIGMIVMLILIILGQIILMLNALFLASGLIYFTDGDVKIKENIAFTSTLSFICITLFACGLGYFLHAAFHDAETEGLLY